MKCKTKLKDNFFFLKQQIMVHPPTPHTQKTKREKEKRKWRKAGAMTQPTCSIYDKTAWEKLQFVHVMNREQIHRGNLLLHRTILTNTLKKLGQHRYNTTQFRRQQLSNCYTAQVNLNIFKACFSPSKMVGTWSCAVLMSPPHTHTQKKVFRTFHSL